MPAEVTLFWILIGIVVLGLFLYVLDWVDDLIAKRQ